MTANEIRDKITTDDKWTVRAILAIFEKQTADEQSSEDTTNSNGVGFNYVDAPILSSFAKQIMAWQTMPRYPSPLSPKQMDIAKKKIGKYAKQLARIAESRA
jgi:hypothetical protein